jgi:hypothetical protein
MKRMTISFDPNHSDELGSDPYLLRVRGPEKKQTFSHALSQYCLNRDDIDLSKWIADGPVDITEVPKRIFVIWLGSAFDANVDGYRENIAKWCAQNPEYPVTLVTDQLTETNYAAMKETSVAAADMISWCAKQGVAICHYRDLCSSHPLIEQALIQDNYGQASDVLRLLLLKDYGGIYIDIDIMPITLSTCHSRKGLLVNRSGMKVMQLNPIDATNGFSNDYLMATCESAVLSPLIDNVVQEMVRLSRLGYRELFSQSTYPLLSGEFKKYNALVAPVNTIEFKKFYTILTTGPEVLFRFRDQCDDVGFYTTTQQSSWLKKFTRLVTLSSDEKYQRLCTRFLYDFEREPSVLDFSRYQLSSQDNEMSRELSTFLTGHFADHLKKIERIHIPLRTEPPSIALAFYLQHHVDTKPQILFNGNRMAGSTQEHIQHFLLSSMAQFAFDIYDATKKLITTSDGKELSLCACFLDYLAMNHAKLTHYCEIFDGQQIAIDKKTIQEVFDKQTFINFVSSCSRIYGKLTHKQRNEFFVIFADYLHCAYYPHDTGYSDTLSMDAATIFITECELTPNFKDIPDWIARVSDHAKSDLTSFITSIIANLQVPSHPKNKPFSEDLMNGITVLEQWLESELEDKVKLLSIEKLLQVCYPNNRKKAVTQSILEILQLETHDYSRLDPESCVAISEIRQLSRRIQEQSRTTPLQTSSHSTRSDYDSRFFDASRGSVSNKELLDSIQKLKRHLPQIACELSNNALNISKLKMLLAHISAEPNQTAESSFLSGI